MKLRFKLQEEHLDKREGRLSADEIAAIQARRQRERTRRMRVRIEMEIEIGTEIGLFFFFVSFSAGPSSLLCSIHVVSMRTSTKLPTPTHNSTVVLFDFLSPHALGAGGRERAA